MLGVARGGSMGRVLVLLVAAMVLPMMFVQTANGFVISSSA